MEADSAHIDPAELLDDSRWIQRIARGLTGDTAAADDAVQETWIAALRKRPRRGVSLRPWLRGALRKTVLEKRREEAGRDRRQRACARPEATPSTAELVERAELQRLIADEVVALAEPYRTTILLRYFEGLSAAEIARRRGLPAATVRSHLARGLERLRQRLDEQHRGDRALWCAVLLKLPHPSNSAPTAGVGAGLLAGTVAMKTLWQVLGVVVVAVSIGIGLWLSRGRDGIDPEAGLSPESGEVLALEEPGEEPPPELSPRPEAGRVEAAPPTEVAPAAEAVAVVTDFHARVEARLVDEEGRGIGGAFLRVADGHGRRRDLAWLAQGFSDSRGEVSVLVPIPESERSVAIVVGGSGFAVNYSGARLVHDETTHLGDLVLGPGGVVTGRVEDHLGVPVAGAIVEASDPHEQLRSDPAELRRVGPVSIVKEAVCATDDAGRFRLEGVAVGSRNVWAGASGRAWVSAGPFEIESGAEIEDVVLVLEELAQEDRIAGVVLSPDGAPVSNARLDSFFFFGGGGGNRSFQADSEGRFSLVLTKRVPHQLMAFDPEDRWSAVDVPDVQPGTTDCVLRFREAEWIDVIVLTEEGEPVERFALTATTGQSLLPSAQETVPLGEHEGGFARLRVPHYDFGVEVEAPGFTRFSAGPFEALTPPDSLEARLMVQPGVHGRVLADGISVVGAKVELLAVYGHGTYRQYEAYAGGFRCLVHLAPVVTATTDEEGHYFISLRAAGRYVIWADASGLVRGELGPFDLAPEQGAAGLDFELGHGGSIAGRVRVGPGEDPTGLVVGISHGDGRPRTQRVARDGEFRFDELSTGGWQVRLCDNEADTQGFAGIGVQLVDEVTPVEWDCEVVEGETTWFDLRAPGSVDCALVGTLHLESGDPTGWEVTLTYTGQEGSVGLRQTNAILAADGAFRLEWDRIGAHEFQLKSPLSPFGRIELGERLELAEGDNPWTATMSLATLTGEGVVSTGTSDARLDLHLYPAEATGGEDRFFGRCEVVPDDDGRFELPAVPAGRVEVRRYDPERESWAEKVLELRLMKGETRHVIVP